MNPKKLLAIHDLSGIGHTSLMAVIPIMYHYGIQTSVLPTSLLSGNTCYPGYFMQDTSAVMQAMIGHWQAMGITFNTIYSGFLGSPRQVEILAEAIKTLAAPDCLIVVDPVLADDGKLYSCYDESMVTSMQQAISFADLITPNYTEACFLTNSAYHQQPETGEIEQICKSLCAMGVKQVIITSIPAGKDTKTCYYHSSKGILNSYDCKYIPTFYPGTGDVFTSLITAKLLNNIDVNTAIREASVFIYEAITKSNAMGRDKREGICLDQMLKLS
ncbi:MAG: pyridoxine kinase [Candidatus Cloacimonetes bacterium HGW-Cloacimonetes-3]|jgi:pyridoxine kinase|nr:MAG: pyridoxine kinase [Candidatus Cloacimonetes bacterium HGW-Cloacimonetes-3]